MGTMMTFYEVINFDVTVKSPAMGTMMTYKVINFDGFLKCHLRRDTPSVPARNLPFGMNFALSKQ